MNLLASQSPSRWPLAALVALIAVACALPAAAAAKSKPFAIGTADLRYVTAESESERDDLFDLTSGLSAEWIRINALWFNIATAQPADPRDPADPAYDFSALDAAVRAADERGIGIVMTLQKAPGWAEGPDRPDGLTAGVWKPDPEAFGDYSFAVATRYDGDFADPENPGDDLPEVEIYQSWNEPNLEKFLAPQFEDGEHTAVERYRELLDASYEEIKAVDPDNEVMMAGTAPLESRGDVRLGPLTFVKELFCLRNNLKPMGGCGPLAEFDIFDHHAIAPRDPAKPGTKDGVRLGDYSKLTEILRAAEKAGTVLPKSSAPRSLWTTEIYWETNPPDKGTGVSLKKAATWLQEGMYLLYEQDVEVVMNFFIRDLPYQGPGVLGNVQGGLVFNDLEPKPGYTAFRFPLHGERLNKKKVEFFTRAPRNGRLRIQIQAPKKGHGKKPKWKTVHTKKVSTGDAFTKKIKLRQKDRPYKYRAKLPKREQTLTGKFK